MTVVVTPIDVKALKRYKEVNPVKFKHKYGDIDLNSISDDFNIFLYKRLVVQERVRREANFLSQDEPKITPELFFPKAVAKSEPLTHAQKVDARIEELGVSFVQEREKTDESVDVEIEEEEVEEGK